MQKYEIFFKYMIYFSFGFETDTKIKQKVVETGTGLEGVVGRHALVEVCAAGGEDPYATDDVAKTLVLLINGGTLRRGGYISIELLGAASEVDVDMRDVMFYRGVILQLGLKVCEELLAGIAHLGGGGCNSLTE
jgi:hypothetical protein